MSSFLYSKNEKILPAVCGTLRYKPWYCFLLTQYIVNRSLWLEQFEMKRKLLRRNPTTNPINPLQKQLSCDINSRGLTADALAGVCFLSGPLKCHQRRPFGCFIAKINSILMCWRLAKRKNSFRATNELLYFKVETSKREGTREVLRLPLSSLVLFLSN